MSWWGFPSKSDLFWTPSDNTNHITVQIVTRLDTLNISEHIYQNTAGKIILKNRQNKYNKVAT